MYFFSSDFLLNSEEIILLSGREPVFCNKEQGGSTVTEFQHYEQTKNLVEFKWVYTMGCT